MSSRARIERERTRHKLDSFRPRLKFRMTMTAKTNVTRSRMIAITAMGTSQISWIDFRIHSQNVASDFEMVAYGDTCWYLTTLKNWWETVSVTSPSQRVGLTLYTKYTNAPTHPDMKVIIIALFS